VRGSDRHCSLKRKTRRESNGNGNGNGQPAKQSQAVPWRNRRVATTTRPHHHGITMGGSRPGGWASPASCMHTAGLAGVCMCMHAYECWLVAVLELAAAAYMAGRPLAIALHWDHHSLASVLFLPPNIYLPHHHHPASPSAIASLCLIHSEHRTVHHARRATQPSEAMRCALYSPTLSSSSMLLHCYACSLSLSVS
jgi:hypothetical protein